MSIDQSTSALGALTGADSATGDLFNVVDVSDTTMGAGGTDKKMTRAELNAAIIRETFQENLVMASGKGIDFSATANGSGTTTSEVLSDYEEGTFTATLTAVTPPTTPVTATGRYRKVGTLCHVQVDFDNVDLTGAAGALSITGLPFTSASQDAFGSVGLVGLGTDPAVTSVGSGVAVMALYKAISLANIDAVAAAGKYIRCSNIYITA